MKRYARESFECPVCKEKTVIRRRYKYITYRYCKHCGTMFATKYDKENAIKLCKQYMPATYEKYEEE